jgi:hypothetical protein
MARVRRFSSNPAVFVAALLAMTALTGCMNGKSLLGESAGLRLATYHDDMPVSPAAVAMPSTARVAQSSDSDVQIAPVAATPEVSAWCDYLREDSAAQATIMRAPSLRGSIDDEGEASLAMGLSVTDLVKAKTIEQSAEVRCRRYLAENGLRKLIFLAPQDLTSAGFRAKSKSIEAQHKEIARLRGKAQRALDLGLADQATATAIQVLADQIIADGSAARSQAERRLRDGFGDGGTANVFGAELLRAESDLEDINNRLRTLDAMDVSVSAGWNDDATSAWSNTVDNSFGGKISFSVKLGALAPARRTHEAAAKDARLRAAGEEGGMMWQAAVLHRAHEKALAGLAEQGKSLASAIAKADKLAVMLASTDNPEFEPPLIEVKLQLIKLRADRAGVEGSIAEIRANMRKLDVSQVGMESDP